MTKNTVDPVQKEYAKLAQAYDGRWRFYIEATLKQTLKKIELQAGERLLDIGCGTGVLLATLEQKYPDVFLSGIDSTQEMLDMAAGRVSKKSQLQQGWAEKLPFAAQTFDVVVACNMFHYIRQPQVALQEMRRVLKPGGRVVMTDWCNDYISNRLYGLFLRLFNGAHVKTYQKTEWHKLLAAAGFDEINIDRYKINWFWGMMTVTALKSDA